MIDPNEEELERIQQRYELLEPLLGDYLSDAQKREHAQMVLSRLRVSDRTLRRYLKRLRERGPRALARQKRSDAGKPRLFCSAILLRAQQLLKQNPHRSVPMLMKLLAQEPELAQRTGAISASTLYYHLKRAGHQFRGPSAQRPQTVYQRFQADYPNQLWQGDARQGIPLPHPSKPRTSKMTYLFAWVDDFSRKIMEARYYWDEKLPRMEDCFHRAVLRWGLPERQYCDNGRVYLSRHFFLLVSDLGIKKIHHPAYCAWCKGKVEAVMKSLKRFQGEAQLAGLKTIEELNATLGAWVEVEYNGKIHSGTGESPNERWRNNLSHHPPKRITDLDAFNALFLWRVRRSIDKFGCIRFQCNSYPIHALPVGAEVELRYNPFDLSEVRLYHQGSFHSILKASRLKRKALLELPEEKPGCGYSPEAAEYFRRIREKATEINREQAEQLRYTDLHNSDQEQEEQSP
jgi:transposase InsO family protein